VDLVRSLGADQVIDYTQEDFTRTGQRYDLILEMAGNRSLADLRRALTPKGTLVLVGGSGGRWFMGTGRTLRAVLVSPCCATASLVMGAALPLVMHTAARSGSVVAWS
jgi:NADPH:quinone reductase-like Zn-dependent oxidoreductase